MECKTNGNVGEALEGRGRTWKEKAGKSESLDVGGGWKVEGKASRGMNEEGVSE